MVINYGNGEIAKSIENVIIFGKVAMKLVVSNLLLMIFILVILNILYEIFHLAVENEPAKILSKIVNELVFAAFLFFIMTNWLGGLNILENIIEPLIFERIPKYIFGFHVGSKPLFVTDGVLLNLDKVWKTLEEIPNRIYDLKSSWKILFEWVLKSNLGFHIIMILLKIFMYIMIILFFADILRLIIEVHLMYIFSGVAFVFMVFKPLRESYGLAIFKTLIATGIQYYLTFVLLGLSTGYLNYIYTVGGKFIYIMSLFLLMGLMKSAMNMIRRIGGKL
ncbi:hypothetical protein EII29_04750 [Leptotrichia sp. OH3620_COT-345]|uniref:hypothetical protein n=1 Tax=Leptotrichia sp. OH3620_COT-345 TaxID=2491048 RepID=UPI000F64DFB1|nr:hypothetical protein [Leptotrichia sp. OH3620_COT-345]RRD39834.1 hypothetical protein EII29_04750 [Leptotrichia sp. OH3620_COT-345]